MNKRMSVNRRFIFIYIRQLLFVGMLLLTLILTVLFVAFDKLNKLEQERDFAKSGLPMLMNSLSEKDGKITFDPELLDQVREQGGWLQLINERNQVIADFETPDDLPSQYNPGELTSYWTRERPFPYGLYVWIQERKGNLYTLIYGVNNPIAQMKRTLLQSVELKNGKIQITGSLAAQISQLSGWVQVINAEGLEIASYHKPADGPSQYAVHDIILRTQYPERYASQLESVFDPATGNTWLVHLPIQNDASGAPQDPYLAMIYVFVISLCILLGIIIILLAIIALWYGHRFGTPILHMIDWLKHLAQGRFMEPVDRKGYARSMNRSGRMKRRFQTYAEMIDSLHYLTESLQKNELIRKQLETTREEWIAGVSHDLKTPLSSIMGYAHVLESNAYEWRQEEIQEFACIIREKSFHMDEMIDDLNLTYRLNNHAVPMQKVEIEMNEFIGKMVLQMQQHPQHEQRQIQFVPAAQPIYYPVDVKYFRRILENLLANAQLHNPPDTHIQVMMAIEEDGAFRIEIQDKGLGMDEATVDRLFERYYRGTPTENLHQGTGLGMAIARQLVHEHDGHIEVESQVGVGTTISLLFRQSTCFQEMKVQLS
ncbi:sensor histidine kinase [Paenibacillus sp. GCM10027629]|uniref:sensor histidine kinase n=1 Tax=Paenibacillus sp. GCM10027629 TaxID=3273414 RepID=UPI00363CB15A